MNDLGKYLLYFLLGGSIVSFSTYLGSQGKSFLAAMASTFPAITGVTFILLYRTAVGHDGRLCEKLACGLSHPGLSTSSP